MDILDKLKDLHEQATKERSHFYVAATTKEAIAVIEDLRIQLDAQSSGNSTWDMVAKAIVAEQFIKNVRRKG